LRRCAFRICWFLPAISGSAQRRVRFEVCRGLDYLGIRVDRRRNDSHADRIDCAASKCLARVIPTNEDLMIAPPTQQVIFAGV